MGAQATSAFPSTSPNPGDVPAWHDPILESLRRAGGKARYYQASSSEMFGATSPPQGEKTPFYPRSPYGAAKVYSYWMAINYREAYGMFASNGILFNHESPRRGETFVTRKITARRGIKAGKQKELSSATARPARRGFASNTSGDVEILQHDRGDDFVIGTGQSNSVKEFLEEAFAYAGLDWKEYVKIDPKYFRPTEVENLIADASKAKTLLGWEPKVTFRELVRIMVDAELRKRAFRPRRGPKLSPPRAPRRLELDQDRTFQKSHRTGHPVFRILEREVTFAGKEDPGHRRRRVPGRPPIRNLVERGARPEDISVPEYPRFDLRRPADCADVVAGTDIVIHLAANAGGIGWNRAHPGALFYDNAAMGIHLMEESRKAGVKKFVQIGTVCAYPFQPPRIPFREDDLWAGYPEPTNAPYGIAKKAMMVMGQAYREEYGFNVIYLLPVNLYGPRDHFFEPEKSHVIPALIHKFGRGERPRHRVTVWGVGFSEGRRVTGSSSTWTTPGGSDAPGLPTLRRASPLENRQFYEGGSPINADRDVCEMPVRGRSSATFQSRRPAAPVPGHVPARAKFARRQHAVQEGLAGRSRGTSRRGGKVIPDRRNNEARGGHRRSWVHRAPVPAELARGDEVLCDNS